MNEPGQLTVFGMHFCHICKNLMKPFQANTNHVVEFLCERCNQKYPVDFALRTESESLLYSKELQVGNFFIIKVPENTFQILLTSSIQLCPL